ncbi:MAG: hypothetical protein AABX93_01015 [Nanoarchaeota archaeon]
MIKLKCGCAIKDDGKFVLGERCKYCTECNVVAEIHPFGNKKLDDLGLHIHEH